MNTELLKEYLDDMKRDIREMRANDITLIDKLNDAKDELRSGLRSEINELRNDLNDAKSDLSNDVVTLKIKITDITEKFDNINRNVVTATICNSFRESCPANVSLKNTKKYVKVVVLPIIIAVISAAIIAFLVK